MAYFGAIAIVASVYVLWREYSNFLDGELLLCRCFLRALSDYREKVRCYVETPSSWAAGYLDEQLSSSGFLKGLIEGDSFAAAYRECDKPPYLTEATDLALRNCFERLGEGYLDTELEVISLAIEKLTREEARLSEALVKRRRAVGCVMGAIASGIVILIM